MRVYQLQIRLRLHNRRCIHLRKTFIKSRHLRADVEVHPGHWREAEIIKKIRIRCAVEWVVEVNINKSIKLQPGDRRVVPARLETIANAHAPDGPARD